MVFEGEHLSGAFSPVTFGFFPGTAINRLIVAMSWSTSRAAFTRQRPPASLTPVCWSHLAGTIIRLP